MVKLQIWVGRERCVRSLCPCKVCRLFQKGLFCPARRHRRDILRSERLDAWPTAPAMGGGYWWWEERGR